MKTVVHATAGTIAFILIASFWISTLVSELFLSLQAIELVKHGILYAMWILIPALMITGTSGFYLAKQHSSNLLTNKKRRMPIIALNGLLLLLPAALYLHNKATSLEFDVYFYGAQCIELIAGAANIVLIGLNIRDGLRLVGRIPLFSSATRPR
jgi:hypothetical protein